MYSSIIISTLILLISVGILIRLFRTLFLIREGNHRHSLFASAHNSIDNGVSRIGISLLCRDTGRAERLRNLLSVEYPDYEVIVVADSLRQPDSLRQLITSYRMIAVDGRMSGDRHTPRVRRMYRSASRCYRRLLLLDVATTGDKSDLDAAFDVATYDYILPLWGDEKVVPGGIERLIIELSTTSHEPPQAISSDVGASVTLYPRTLLDEVNGVAGSDATNRLAHRMLFEPIAVSGNSHARIGQIISALLIVAATISILLAMLGIATEPLLLVALSLLSIIVFAYVAHTILTHRREIPVGYGDTLYLFCKNLLPRVWQIRK